VLLANNPEGSGFIYYYYYYYYYYYKKGFVHSDMFRIKSAVRTVYLSIFTIKNKITFIQHMFVVQRSIKFEQSSVETQSLFTDTVV
jgi:hypothetical protein